MKRAHVEALLWALAVLVAGYAWREARGVVPAAAAAGEERLAAPPAPLRFAPGPLSVAASSVARGDPFRLDRRPAPVAFSARPDAMGGVPGMMQPPPPPPPPRPQLAVSGIVGPPWTALLEGVPGRDGPVLVRGGERLGELQVRQVGPNGVVVVGMDTIWRLTIRKAWQ